MRIGFTETAEHRIRETDGVDLRGGLPRAIYQHTEWNYLSVATENGYFLRPSFRNMPYRNSFAPEINVVVSREEGQTVLRMEGRPTDFVRIYMRFLLIAAAAFEAIVLIIAATDGVEDIFPIFIPLILFVFGYLLCKLATKASFRSAVKGIRKAFP